jgi:hypothetical protein
MALLSAGGVGAQPLQWAGQLAAATELTDRGLLIGPRRPTLQAGLTAAHDQGWALSLSASTPLGALRQGRVLAQISRYRRLSDDWQVEGGLAYYAYPGDATAGNGNRWELQSGASYRDVLSVGLTALHYPAWPGRRAGLQWAVDLGLRWPMAAGWSVTASLGRADLPPVPQRHYRYGGLGLAWQGDAWRLELNRLGSDATARRVMGPAGQSRWSATATHQF